MTTKVTINCPYQKDYRVKVVQAEGDIIHYGYVNPGELQEYHVYGKKSITISEEPIAYALPATE